MSKHIWATRHAPVVAPGVCYGRFDVPVDRSAVEAATTLLDRVPFSPPKLLHTSPTIRCRQVAIELGRHWDAEVHIDERLAELAMGRFEGKTWAEIEATDAEAYSLWMRDWRTSAPPGGESPLDLEKRVRSFLHDIDELGHHVLVTHAGVWRALMVIARGISWDDAMAIAVPHLTWMELEIQG